MADASHVFARLRGGDPARLAIATLLLACALVLAGILALNDGRLVYTLDDAYIHLSLAENVGRGQYGVNPGEPAAPASSILWPILLAPFTGLGVGHVMPLLLNLLAGIGVVLVATRILRRVVEPRETPERRTALLLAAVLFLPATNLVGLVFTGMEHTLQLLLTLALVLGLIREGETGSAPRWILVPLVAGPLIRFENLAISLPALVYLVARRHYAVAVLGLVLVGAGLGAFSLFLRFQDLHFVPSSVLVKSEPVASGAHPTALVGNLDENLRDRQGALLALGLVLLAFAAVRRGSGASDRLLAGTLVLAAALHLIGGRFGWLSRYEIYVWGAVLLTLLYVHRGSVRRFADTHSVFATAFLLGALVLVLCPKYLFHSVVTPLASNNIYEQHYQMRRFAVDHYRAPVAVNDLGLVSYRNESYVLDLWGLSSRDALEMRTSGSDSSWMATLAGRRDVRLAMIYGTWFPDLPEGWAPIAELELGRARVSPARAVVNFYALDESGWARGREALDAFEPTLPEGVRLTRTRTYSPRSER